MTFIFRNMTIFWNIPKWNKGQTKWDGGSTIFQKKFVSPYCTCIQSILMFMSMHPNLHPLQIDLSFEDNPTKHSWFAGAYWIDVENHINTHKPSSALKGSKRLVWQSVSWIAKPNAIKEKQPVQLIGKSLCLSLDTLDTCPQSNVSSENFHWTQAAP